MNTWQTIRRDDADYEQQIAALSRVAQPNEAVFETVRNIVEHVRLKGRLVPFAGWELPVQYAGLVQEHQAVRTGAGLFDVSHMGELELEGPEAGAVIDGLVTNDVSKLSPRQAQYTCACNEQGTILDDLIVYRLAAERWLIVCNA